MRLTAQCTGENSSLPCDSDQYRRPGFRVDVAGSIYHDGSSREAEMDAMSAIIITVVRACRPGCKVKPDLGVKG
jgi:hypothetical protein